MHEKVYNVLLPFCGIGGGAIGFQRALKKYKNISGRFNIIAGIDSDSEACEDFEHLTGTKAIQMDLFSREDYIDWHGKEPPADWREIYPDDIRRICGNKKPDVIFTSPPCKGFSGLLPQKSAKSKKYQALNRLTIRGLWIILQAYEDDLPSLVLLENVPRIKSRGKKELRTITSMLERYGYAVSYADHDCGEIGGLGQTRKRFLLIARNPEKMSAFVYQPLKKNLRSIGDVLETLPMPGTPSMGPMHRLPRLQWKTWVRLALIPAGGDWRDLEKIAPKQYQIEHNPRTGVFQIANWNEPSKTVVGHARPGGSNGVAAVADPRTGFKSNTHQAIYRVCCWEEAAKTITGANRPNNGSLVVDDPRIKCRPRSGSYGVQKWDLTAKTVIGASDIHAGAVAVADPRIPKDNEAGKWVIISLDGAWHRPLTTMELAVLQSLDPVMPDGRFLELAGNSDARWRERIGNMVPPDAAEAIAGEMLMALLVSEKKEWVLGATPLWVQPAEELEQEANL